MCAEYHINGKQISSKHELVEILGKDNIVYHSDNLSKIDGCLCSVDAWKTAEKNNLRILQTSMDYFFGDIECDKEIEFQKRFHKELSWYKDSKEVGYNG